MLSAANALLHRDPRIVESITKHETACMRERGFAWKPNPFLGYESVDAVLATYVGPVTLEEARVNGYRSKEKLRERREDAQEDPAADAAYFGDFEQGVVSMATKNGQYEIASNGCIAESYRRAFSSAEEGMVYVALPGQLSTLAAAQTARDRRNQQLNDVWKMCMVDRGESEFTTPAEAEEAGLKSEDGMKELAIKDAECRVESKFSQFWRTKFAEHFAPLLETHNTEIQAYREATTKALEKAGKP